jgi:hypothetical protein
MLAASFSIWVRIHQNVLQHRMVVLSQPEGSCTSEKPSEKLLLRVSKYINVYWGFL